MAEDRTAAIRARLDRPAKTPLVHRNSLLEACSLRVRMRGDTFEVQYPNETAKARADLIANAPADIAFLLDENARLRERSSLAHLADIGEEAAKLTAALKAIAEHPCQNREYCCGPAPEHHSMGRIARMALGLPEPKEGTE
jgi:hypothetical protein